MRLGPERRSGVVGRRAAGRVNIQIKGGTDCHALPSVVKAISRVPNDHSTPSTVTERQ